MFIFLSSVYWSDQNDGCHVWRDYFLGVCSAGDSLAFCEWFRVKLLKGQRSQTRETEHGTILLFWSCVHCFTMHKCLISKCLRIYRPVQSVQLNSGQTNRRSEINCPPPVSQAAWLALLRKRMFNWCVWRYLFSCLMYLHSIWKNWKYWHVGSHYSNSRMVSVLNQLFVIFCFSFCYHQVLPSKCWYVGCFDLIGIVWFGHVVLILNISQYFTELNFK